MFSSEQKAWIGTFMPKASPAFAPNGGADPVPNGADPGADLKSNTLEEPNVAAGPKASDGPAAEFAFPDEQAGAPPPGQEALSDTPGTERFGIAPAVIIPVIISGLKTLTGELVCNVSMTNSTGKTLTLDPSSVGKPKSGEFKGPLPKGTLAKDDTTNFVVHSIDTFGISVTGVETTIRYFVGDKNTIWSCHFENPRTLTDPLGTNNASSKVEGPGATGLSSKDHADHGSVAAFTFTLLGGGDGPPTPKPTDGGTKLNCLVTVLNQTQTTLFLRKQDKASGDYMTNPASSLAPGASTEFAFVSTPDAKDTTIRGLMTWEAGDPKIATWDLMWENPAGKKNITAAFLKPDNTGLHSLDQIGQGDENVPVNFTLSGAGTPPPPPPGKGGAMTMTVENKTGQALTMTATKSTRGALKTQPPASLAAGATGTFVAADSGDGKGVAGTVAWAVGSAGTWTIGWDEVPGAAPTVTGTAGPAEAKLVSAQTATTTSPTDAAATFTLSGGAAPPAEEAFAPPPKSKQPTLRKGDDSPDGWVEYAQQLLTKNKLNQPVDGKFDGAMEKRVRTFQGTNGLQVDGVIGNETWSILREGPKEKVGTDGRAPHSFEEKGAQARFAIERPDFSGYLAAQDLYYNFIVSTGEQPIDAFKATVKVTQTDGTSHTHSFPIGPVAGASPDGQGNTYRLTIPKFRDTFGIADPAGVGTSTVDSYLDQAIGGDRFTGPIPLR